MSTSKRRAGLAVIALIIASLSAVATHVLWAATSAPSMATTPESNSAEAGFARDMQVHHAQAVDMALIVRDRTDDPVVRAIAYDIATAQQQQMGQMYAWLELWGLPQTGVEQPMAWMTPTRSSMDHDSMHGTPETSKAEDSMLLADGRMPGMASDAELQRLESSSGRSAERLFLRLMIQHHQAGIVMAQAVLDKTDVTQVRAFAERIVASQTAEVMQMQQLLSQLEESAGSF